jgi:hypothetical protein
MLGPQGSTNAVLNRHRRGLPPLELWIWKQTTLTLPIRYSPLSPSYPTRSEIVPHSKSENHKPDRTSINRKSPLASGFATTRLLLISYTTQYSILSISNLSKGYTRYSCKGVVMQLGFIELWHLSAQSWHKVKIIKRKPIEGSCIGACLAQRKEG